MYQEHNLWIEELNVFILNELNDHSCEFILNELNDHSCDSRKYEESMGRQEPR